MCVSEKCVPDLKNKQFLSAANNKQQTTQVFPAVEKSVRPDNKTHTTMKLPCCLPVLQKNENPGDPENSKNQRGNKCDTPHVQDVVKPKLKTPLTAEVVKGAHQPAGNIIWHPVNSTLPLGTLAPTPDTKHNPGHCTCCSAPARWEHCYGGSVVLCSCGESYKNNKTILKIDAKTWRNVP